MRTQDIQHIKASSAPKGPRGEIEHVREGSNSVNVWALRDLKRGETHANPYSIAIYVIDGQLDVFPENGDVANVKAGDSVLIPAGANYAMSAESANLVEFRSLCT